MQINKKEVLRYLEYKNQIIDENMDILIDECIEEAKKYIRPKYIFNIFNIEKSIFGVKLLNTNLIFKGNDIMEQLKDSEKCAVMAVTLGNIIDSKIKYYQKCNLTKAVILDACATSAAECVCDEVQNKIEEEAEKQNLGITYRYSPGYGDFNIDIQSKILQVLDTQRKVGLTSTEECILIPKKSVTAVIGFQNKDIISISPGCNKCSKFETCSYRRGGKYCGN